MKAADPNLVSVADFAKLHDVSTFTGYAWRDRGWLVLKGKKVDVKASNALLAKQRDPADARAARGPAKTTPAPPPPLPPLPPLPPVPAAPDPMRGVVGGDALRPGVIVPETDEEIMAAALGANFSTEEARRVKENFLALKGKLDYERAAGALVDLETAKSILFTEARAVRDVILNFAAKYGPLIAADLGIEAERVVLVLTGYMHKQVDSLGEPVGDFTG